jgi:peptidoglycan/LPS O-acetylase OafA/YrhL
MGAVAYIARPKNKNKIVLLGSVLGILLFVALYQISKESNSVHLPIVISNSIVVEVLLSVCMCLFIQQIVLFEPRSGISKLIEKTLGYMGNFSYSLYLSHRIVLMWVFGYMFAMNKGDMSLSSLLQYGAVVVTCLFICWLFSLVSERYTPHIKKELKRVFKVKRQSNI